MQWLINQLFLSVNFHLSIINISFIWQISRNSLIHCHINNSHSQDGCKGVKPKINTQKVSFSLSKYFFFLNNFFFQEFKGVLYELCKNITIFYRHFFHIFLLLSSGIWTLYKAEGKSSVKKQFAKLFIHYINGSWQIVLNFWYSILCMIFFCNFHIIILLFYWHVLYIPNFLFMFSFCSKKEIRQSDIKNNMWSLFIVPFYCILFFFYTQKKLSFFDRMCKRNQTMNT